MENWKWILIAVASGFGCGLMVYIVMAIKRRAVRKAGQAEINKYKAMLADRMELENEGIAKLKSENAELKLANENLRASMMALSQKPGRKELERLQAYQRAVDRLTINSPGFGPAWQAALQESESEMQKAFSGVIPFIRKHIPSKTDAQLLEDD